MPRPLSSDPTYISAFPERYDGWRSLQPACLRSLALRLLHRLELELKTESQKGVPGLRMALNTLADMAHL